MKSSSGQLLLCTRNQSASTTGKIFVYNIGFIKEQVFKEDKGHDFKERAGKISAAEIKEEERVATEAILKNREAVSKHPELAPAKTEVTKLLKIADLIMKGFGLTKELLVLEKTISEVSIYMISEGF